MCTFSAFGSNSIRLQNSQCPFKRQQHAQQWVFSCIQQQIKPCRTAVRSSDPASEDTILSSEDVLEFEVQQQRSESQQHSRRIDEASTLQSRVPPQTAQDAAGSPGGPQLWEVPWNDWRTASIMVQLWALMLPLGYGGVAIFGQLQGLTAETMDPTNRAVAAAASEALQLGGMAFLLRGALQPYRPLPLPWFCYRADGKALLNGVAGGVASLAAVAVAAALLAVMLEAVGSGTEAAEVVPRSQGEIADILRGGSLVGSAAAAAASVVLAPVLEEAVYRGFLLPSLTRRLPAPAAVALSSAAFAAAHFSAADAIPLFILGSMLSVTTLAAEGNLVAPTVAHMLYNGVVFWSVAIHGLSGI